VKAVLLVVALGGCVTTAGLVKKDKVTLPLFLGAVAADLVVGSIVFAQLDLSTAGAIASGIAFTAVDLGIGCITGACAALRP
jgi:hypothetical protein